MGETSMGDLECDNILDSRFKPVNNFTTTSTKERSFRLDTKRPIIIEWNININETSIP
jgi:hypothetical protein